MNLLILVAGLFGTWLLGVTLCLALKWICGVRSSAKTSLFSAETAGQGILLGIASSGLLQLIWSMCGGPLGRPFSLMIAAVGFVLTTVHWQQSRATNRAVNHRAHSKSVPTAKGSSQRALKKGASEETFPPPAPGVALIRVCKVLVGLLFLNLAIQTLLTPQRLWDERAIYGIKAAVIFEDRSVNSPALLDPDFVQYHPQYPLLISLAEHHIYALLGAVDDRVSKILFPLMLLGGTLVFVGVLTPRIGDVAAWVGAVLLMTVPVLNFWEYGALCGQADAPVAVYHGVAVLSLWAWISALQASRENTHTAESAYSLLIGGLYTGLTVFVKDEGIAYLMVDATLLAICSLVLLRKNGRQLVISALSLIAVLLCSIGPWLLHKRQLPTTGEMSYFSRLTPETLAAGVSSLPFIGRHLLHRLFGEALIWGWQWWGVVLTALMFPLRTLRWSQLFLLGDLIGGISGMVVAGMVAPTTVYEHIPWSSHRFLMQLVPVAVLFIMTQWSVIDASESAEKSLEPSKI